MAKFILANCSRSAGAVCCELKNLIFLRYRSNCNVSENSDRVPASRTRRETNDCNSRDHLGRGLGCVVL